MRQFSQKDVAGYALLWDIVTLGNSVVLCCLRLHLLHLVPNNLKNPMHQCLM